MKEVVLKVPEDRADEFTRKLAELMKESGVVLGESDSQQYEPEEGDFVAFADESNTEPYIGIFKGWYCGSRDEIVCYAHISGEGELDDERDVWNANVILRPATDEEKERLVKALAKDKRRWNLKTKAFDTCMTYEAIRTFDDAFNAVSACAESGDKLAKDLIVDLQFNSPRTLDLEAYIKLRIVAYAINEGWQPKFTKDENRYYPWFYLYTQEEIDDMSEKERAERGLLLVGGYANGGSPCGLSFAASSDAFSDSSALIGARLAFYDPWRAAFAGRQFIELYAALNFRAVGTDCG